MAELQADGIVRVEDGNHGEYRPRRDEFSAEGTAFIRAANIVDGGVDFDGAERITDVALARIRKGIGEPNDVLLTHKGTVGRVGRVPADAPPFVCSPQTTFWRVLDEDQLDREYLAAFMRSPRFGQQLYARMHGSDMAPYVSLTEQRSLSLDLPPIGEQRAIGAVLRPLDDKIENNRRVATALEEIAATLFKACFVDFVGHDDLIESEIGPIPRGWGVLPVSEAVTINPRVPAVKNGSVAPHVAMADVDRWAVRPERFEDREYSGGARFEPGDTLMARITGCIEHGKGAFVDFLDGPGTGSTEFLVLRAKPPFTPEMVFLLSRSAHVREHAIANMTGSSGRQRVQTVAFDHISIPVPPSADSVVKEGDVLRTIFARTRVIWQESRILTALRDTLLPKLISGQVRVPAISAEGAA